MKASRVFVLAAVASLVSAAGIAAARPTGSWPAPTGLPLGGAAGGLAARSQPIIVDHTTTDLSRVPPYWIERAKALLRASYGHTSHGSQLVSGMAALMDDPASNHLWDFNRNGAVQAGVLSLADGTPSGDLGNPDRSTWADLTRSYLAGAGGNRNAVLWSWCGQASSASAGDIDTYLRLMSTLEVEHPGVTFVYMTGHLDGSGPGGNLYQRNNQIRAYVRQNNRVLFDFADIESYDPAGTYYPAASDDCAWCAAWCSAHPADCAQLPGSCAHSHPFNCLRKGRAFWWMMARLAGWEGEGAPRRAYVPYAFGGRLVGR